jgi:hypothetical protein
MVVIVIAIEAWRFIIILENITFVLGFGWGGKRSHYQNDCLGLCEQIFLLGSL